MNDEKYRNMEKLVAEFEGGIGKKLQRYLVLKSWWATNYVSHANQQLHLLHIDIHVIIEVHMQYIIWLIGDVLLRDW